MRRWTRPLPAEPDRVILSNVWTTSTCYKPLEIERIVYVVDAEGKQEPRFAPFIDATLQGPDVVFALLRTYLQRLEITQADQVLFIADGAPWIWKRVPLLVQALGLAVERVHELLDFYHAVHHLGQVAAL